MLGAWPAANENRLPLFYDTDRRITSADLSGGERYFCRLEFGSRAGLCTSSEYWEPSNCSPKCLATLRGEPCGTCFQDGKRRRREDE